MWFEKVLVFLGSLEMPVPTNGGWFHLMWVGIIVLLAAFFIVARIKGWKINDRAVFGIYGFSALLTEVIKQLMWSVSVNSRGDYLWSYQWYSAPFQLCTTPMFVSIALVFINNKKVREALASYLAFFTLLCTTSVMFYPDTCFTKDVLVNIHTMLLHAGGVVVGLYSLIFGLTDIKVKSLLRGFIVFISFVVTALLLDLIIPATKINQGAVFNMFYISPYWPNGLPVLDSIDAALKSVGLWPLFPVIYVLVFAVGSSLVFGIAYFVKNRFEHSKRKINM